MGRKRKTLNEYCAQYPDRRLKSPLPDEAGPSALPSSDSEFSCAEAGEGRHLHSPVENGQHPDPAHWAVSDVVNYFKAAGFDEQACAFQDQEIDGKSLLLMTRNDVLTGLSIKLGPALKMYEYHVKPLQTQHLKKNTW
ncbi:UNVERIFIED_CONTAM: hypothetical protein FKN15_077061 [Acipenser sinensis]